MFETSCSTSIDLFEHAENVFHVLDHPSHIPPVFGYYQLCDNRSDNFCFYDSNYLCICDENYSHAECFGYNSLLDRCDSCLSGGKCVRGHLSDTNDFICLCPHCYQGARCEFSLQAFGFTLDSLLVSVSSRIQGIYISLAVLLFLLGLLSNSCSLLTFRRVQPRKVAVGQYLLIVSIFNQLSLLCLLFKFIHILASTFGVSSDASCKSISYLLSIFTRTVYWLTSWITVNRLLIAVFPTKLVLKNPRNALVCSSITFLVLCGMHIHEIIFYTTIRQLPSPTLLCVTSFDQDTVATYNRVNCLFHYIAPFIIQVTAITFLIVRIARHRVKMADGKITLRLLFKKELSTQEELYIMPSIIIVSAVPQAILSFTFACTTIGEWKRHTLIIAFLLSYVPQVLGFVLYVLPSSAYKKEFRNTTIGTKLFELMDKQQHQQIKATTVTKT